MQQSGKLIQQVVFHVIGDRHQLDDNESWAQISHKLKSRKNCRIGGYFSVNAVRWGSTMNADQYVQDETDQPWNH